MILNLKQSILKTKNVEVFTLQKILDNDLRTMIKGKSTKNMVIIFSLIEIITIFCAIFVHIAFSIGSLLCLFVILVFLIDKLVYVKRYENQMQVNDNYISLYNSRGKKIRSFDLTEYEKCFLMVSFSYNINIKGERFPETQFIYKKCLVFYKDIDTFGEQFVDLYSYIDYNVHYNNPKLIIIENPSLIKQLS